MSNPEIKPGDDVLYVADLCHARERDANGTHVFEFVHVTDAPNSAHAHKKGDRAQLGLLGSVEAKDGARHDHATGCLHTAGGHAVKPTKPAKDWHATVLAVAADGKATLGIRHPHGHTLEYPNVPYSAAGDLHTWHLPTEGA